MMDRLLHGPTLGGNRSPCWYPIDTHRTTTYLPSERDYRCRIANENSLLIREHKRNHLRRSVLGGFADMHH